MALAALEALKKDDILFWAVILSIAGFATWFGVDYEWRGILMMVVFYLFGNVSNPSFPSGRKAQIICSFPLMMHYGIVGALLACLVIACYNGTRGFIHGQVASFPSGRKAQIICSFPLMMHYGIVGALLACLVIACYNGTRGFIHGQVVKYGFYAFYPVHLILLFYIISMLKTLP